MVKQESPNIMNTKYERIGLEYPPLPASLPLFNNIHSGDNYLQV